VILSVPNDVQDGETFKVTSFYQPYFYVGVSEDRFIPEVTQLLERKFDQFGKLDGFEGPDNNRHEMLGTRMEMGFLQSLCLLIPPRGRGERGRGWS
jgi:hypothetical protein